MENEQSKVADGIAALLKLQSSDISPSLPELSTTNSEQKMEMDDEKKDLETDQTQRKKRRSSVFVPTRNPEAASAVDRGDFVQHAISKKKLKDDTQDAECPQNKNFRFRMSALKHRTNNSVWVLLSDLLLALGYSAGSAQVDARKAFMDSLECFLCEDGSTHPTELFVQKIGSRYFLSAEGFTLLVPILLGYDKANNMIQHVKRNRFEYLKIFFEVEIVAESGPFADDIEANVCRICCFEDLETQFDAFCDCGFRTHLRCSKRGTGGFPIPTTDDDEYFCPNCVKYLPIETLRSRRIRSAGGEFEVEVVLGFNSMRSHGYSEEDFPYGAYYVKWKDYPEEANQYVELDESFSELVQDFWAEQAKRPNGQTLENIAREHFREVTGKWPPSPGRKRVSGSKRKRSTTDDEDLLDEDCRPKAKRMKLDYVPDTNYDNEYIPMKLAQIMEQKHILRRQEYTKFAKETREKKLDSSRKLLETLKKTGRREIGRRLKKMKVIPDYFVENEQTEWRSADAENTDQIVALHTRNWDEWTHDTSSASVEIGEITDEEHPAKKYTLTGPVYGLFATEDIPSGRVLMEYTGIVSTAREAEEKIDHVLHELDQTMLMELKGRTAHLGHRSYWGRDCNAMVIDPHLYHNEAVFLNDFRDNLSEDPDDEDRSSDEDGDEVTDDALFRRKKNISLLEVIINGWPHVFAVSTRDIKKGQELLTDYGARYWDTFRTIHRRQMQIAEVRAEDENTRQLELEEFKKKMEGEISGLRDALSSVLRVLRHGYPEAIEELKERGVGTFLEAEAEPDQNMTSG